MKIGLRARTLAVAVGVATVLVGVMQLGSSAGAPGSNPCPSTWFPLPAQPYPTQVACGQLRQQADLNGIATAQARPYATTVPNTPNPAFTNSGPQILSGEIPDWVKTVGPVNEIILVGAPHAKPVTSVWQAGYIPSANHRGYAQILVYAVGTSRDNSKQTIIRDYWPVGDMSNPGYRYNSAWLAPRDIGDITITGITGIKGVVSFTSASAGPGSLDMSTGVWHLGQ